MGRPLKFKLSDTTLTSDVNQTLSNLLSQTNKVKKTVTVVSGVANAAFAKANSVVPPVAQPSTIPSVSYMIGPGNITLPPTNSTGLPITTSGLSVVLNHFSFAAQLLFNTICFGYVGGTGSIFVNFGIYSGTLSATPKTLLWASGPIAVPWSSGNMEVTVPTYTLLPGDYYLASTSTAGYSGLQLYGYNLDGISTSGATANSLNHSMLQVAVATNTATLGPPLALPPTLGTLLPNPGGYGLGWPLVSFYKL
jgi:hypothetical protein